MKLIDWIIFGALALGAHVAVVLWTYAPQGGDTGSGGAQGADRITVTAASAQTTQMIETWSQPPEVMDQTPSQTLPTPQSDQMLTAQVTQRATDVPLVTQAAPMFIETVADEIIPNTPAPLMAPPVIDPAIAQIADLPNRPAHSNAAPRNDQLTPTSDAQPPRRATQPQRAPMGVSQPALDTATAQLSVTTNTPQSPKHGPNRDQTACRKLPNPPKGAEPARLPVPRPSQNQLRPITAAPRLNQTRPHGPRKFTMRSSARNFTPREPAPVGV